MEFQQRKYEYPKALREKVKATNDETLAGVKQMWLDKSMFGARGGSITWYVFAYPHVKLMLLEEAMKKENAHREAFYANEIARAEKYYGVTK